MEFGDRSLTSEQDEAALRSPSPASLASGSSKDPASSGCHRVLAAVPKQRPKALTHNSALGLSSEHQRRGPELKSCPVPCHDIMTLNSHRDVPLDLGEEQGERAAPDSLPCKQVLQTLVGHITLYFPKQKDSGSTEVLIIGFTKY